jgi:hypothetical protein
LNFELVLTGFNVLRAHGGWLGWPANTGGIGGIMTPVLNDAIKRNPKVAKAVVGFATNVANYSPVNSNGLSPATDGSLQNNNGQLEYQGLTFFILQLICFFNLMIFRQSRH